MLSFVCVLHSADGTYRDGLVSEAASCASALSRSVAGASPDFIPVCAVLRADPVVGVQYLYSSFLPDTNHAIEAAEMHHAPFAPSLERIGAPSGGQEGDSSGFGKTLRGRSECFMCECIFAGTRARPTATPPPGGADPWAPLAAALFTGLAFFDRQAANTQDVVGAQQQQQQQQQHGSGGDASAPSPVARCRTVLLVFSDAVSPAPLRYATECAFAVAALTAAKRRVPVFCFGETVAEEPAPLLSSSPSSPAKDAQATAAVSPGSARLRAVAASVGGACAPHFSLAHVGMLLDGGAAPPDAVRGGDTAARALRERIADQYVVCPTVLPMPPPGASAAPEGDEGSYQPAKKRVRTQPPRAATEAASPALGHSGGGGVRGGAGVASHLCWLCPQCMAVVHRTHAQTTAATDNKSGDDFAEGGCTVVCPYCL